jgi:ABC-type sugar transport system ATPase subunit
MDGIRVKGLWKSFDDTPVLKDVNIEVPAGESLVLLGPSGCGKTTTLRCVAGLEQPSAGEISLNGQTVLGDGIDVAPKDRRIGFVFQTFAIYPHMSVYNNVAFRLGLRREPRARIREQVLEALRMVDLEGFEERSPRELSGGQRQRVALARAIVGKPGTLLCDEPLSNLDPPLRASLRTQLLALQRRTGATMLYVTHDQEEAMIMADRVAVMAEGEILQVGAPSEVYAMPRTVKVAELTGELQTNLIAGEVHKAEDRTLLVPQADPWFFIRLDEECRRYAGEQVVFNVRPEDLEVQPVPPADEGRARVLAVMPRGTDWLVHLRLGERHGQIVATGGAAAFAALRPGQEVGVRFRRGTIHDAPTGKLVSSFGYGPPGQLPYSASPAAVLG